MVNNNFFSLVRFKYEMKFVNNFNIAQYIFVNYTGFVKRIFSAQCTYTPKKTQPLLNIYFHSEKPRKYPKNFP